MIALTHNASLEPCCDEPDLVTKYYPTVACRNCGRIWDEGIPEAKPVTRLAGTKLPKTA
jgi:hypothetical protein